jgi:hypothetical protein
VIILTGGDSMKKRRKLWVLLACVGFGGGLLAGGPTPIWALDLEGIKVTPSVAYKGEYDDNLFRTPNNTTSDYINHIMPGIAVEATPGNHILRADFLADILLYSKNTNQNTQRYYANLSTIFNFNRLQLHLKESFAHTDTPPNSSLAFPVERNENYLNGGFDYDVIQRWGIGFDFTWGNTNYLDPTFDFISENAYTYATNIFYRITGKTRVFAEFDFVQDVFWNDRTRDDYRYRGLLGVRGDLTERLSLTAKGGYEYLDYYQSNIYPNQNNFVIALEASYRPLERLQIGLAVIRSVQASTFANNADYGSFNTTLVVTYAFTPKILILPRAAFGLDNYKVAEVNPSNGTLEKRLDYLYGVGIGIRYQPQKWLQLEANYQFERRNSNFNEFNYSDNRVFFTVALSM